MQWFVLLWLADFPSIMASRFMLVVAGVRVSLLFKAECYFTVWMDHVTDPSIHPSPHPFMHIGWLPPIGYCEY